MLLLPDMDLDNGMKLSIQDPYTLNGSVITYVDGEYGLTSNDIAIKNENHDHIYISREYATNQFNRQMNNFIREHGDDASVEGMIFFDSLHSYTFEDYLYRLTQQSNCLRSNSYNICRSELERYKHRLRRQGRSSEPSPYAEALLTIPHDDSRELLQATSSYINYDGLTTSTTTLAADFAHTESSSSLYGTTDTLYNSFNNYVTGRVATSVLSSESQYKYIHEYNYKPEYIKHYMQNEDCSTLLLGAEIEVDCGGKSDEHARNVLEIVCGKDEDVSGVDTADPLSREAITYPRSEVVDRSHKYVMLKDGFVKESIQIWQNRGNGIGYRYALADFESVNTYCLRGNKLWLPTDENTNKFFLAYNVTTYGTKIKSSTDAKKDVKEDKMYCMHDGSLKCGIEFTTMPMTLNYHKNQMKYREMFDYLDKNGYKAHDTSTCGLHVHADRAYLGKTELTQQLTIAKILYILEKFNDEICVIARRDNSYCKFVGKNEKDQSLAKLYNKYNGTDKYVALNLKHDNTIEFRCFKGTLKYETFILTLEFVQDIIEYAKSINIEDVELIKWQDLMSTFSDELKAYYNDRLKKEQGKKHSEDKKENTSGISWGSGTLYYGAGTPVATIGNINADNRILASDALSSHLDSVPASRGERATTLAMIDLDYFEPIPEEVCTILNHSESDLSQLSIDALKAKIKDVKQKLKHCNYFEKQQLQKELNDLQKELKIKKKNRQNNR